MNYFYILKSIDTNFLYYGSTSNLQNRLETHNLGKVKSTKNKAPYNLVYYEAYTTLQLAKKREYDVKKNWAAKQELKKRLNI